MYKIMFKAAMRAEQALNDDNPVGASLYLEAALLKCKKMYTEKGLKQWMSEYKQ